MMIVPRGGGRGLMEPKALFSHRVPALKKKILCMYECMYVCMYVFIAGEQGEGQRYLPLQHPCPLPLLLLPHGNTTYHVSFFRPHLSLLANSDIFFIQFECPLSTMKISYTTLPELCIFQVLLSPSNYQL